MKTTEKPQSQDFHIENVRHISPFDALEAIKNNEAVLIDVREEGEVKLEYIPLDNVLNHPMSVIMERLPYIAKDQHIILGCPGGVRSSKVANLLNLQGYPHVANLDGGFEMWKAQGLPWERNISSGIGCGCDCIPVSNKTDGGCC
jgi:rhodanese-related sulfurtransferase